MSNHERTKWASFTAIATLAGLLIVIISQHTLFPELLFYSVVTILIGVIVVLVAYAFLWKRIVRDVRTWRRKRRENILARKYFGDFRDFVDRFSDLSTRIMGTLEALDKVSAGTGFDRTISRRITGVFIGILQTPLSDLRRRLNDLWWHSKSEINCTILECLVKEFEGYVTLHMRLYIDLASIIASRIGVEKIPEPIKRGHSMYREDYNQFIVTYSEFARRSAKAGLRVFNEHLHKMLEW